jgi:curli biogenesis system outer membrane secretion channel CsgG
MVGAGLLWGQTSTLTTATKTPGKTNVAVINMKNASGVTTGEIEVISDRLRGELFNTGKVNVMERDQMQEILKEQGFQQSGACTNEACMVEIGQLLGVEQLVTGSLGKVGSMFLVNLRVIDVKTAKIMKVVSVDIKGDIEEVVGELPGIASQLVGQTAPAVQAKPVEKKTEEKSVERVKEEKPQVEEKKEEPTEEKKVEVTDERTERNKNRFGVRLGMNIFGVKPKRMFDNSDSTVDYDRINSDVKITRSPLINYNVKFVLKAGPVITIDIGGGYSRQETDYEGVYAKEAHTADIFSFPSFGVNFVKRWYPLKLNVGIMADFNILNYTVDRYLWDYNFASYAKDTTMNWMGLNGGFGARAGLEIMAGKHVGFNVDFVYYYSSFTTFPQTIDYGYNTSSDLSWEITMPPIAVGLGVNFYF